MSRIVGYVARLMWPFCLVFGLYVVSHGHLTPGGGFQGGAVMATGAALMMVSGVWDRARTAKQARRAHVLETLGLLAFLGTALCGAFFGAGFFQNWLANAGGLFGAPAGAGPNPGAMGTAGTLPLMNLAVGVEVLGGITVILHCLLRAMEESLGEEPEAEDDDVD